MTRPAVLALLLAACSARPAHAPHGQGGAGGDEPGGSGGELARVCFPLDRRSCSPPGTTTAQRGVGSCTDGWQLCAADGSSWGPCAGGVPPRSDRPDCDGVDQDCDGADAGCTSACGPELCGNGLDDDCDGAIDQPSVCWMLCAGVDVESPQPPELACCLDGTCEHLGCDLRTEQPCYSGPPATAGKGICHGGRFSCVGDWTELRWSSCEGEQLPAVELCGNDLDDDCDGRVDEEDGRTRRRCRLPCTTRGERCNGVDDDCDGFADEGCEPRAQSQLCYAGPPGTRHVGACRDGVQVATEGAWSPCTSTGPTAETCGDGIDSDCDGLGGPGAPEDAGCCARSGPEVCNGEDDDCDGLVDEGLVNACGGCDTTCYEELFTVDCHPESCRSIAPVPGRPDAFTLGRTEPRGSLLVPVVDRGLLANIELFSGQRTWQADTHVSGPRFVAQALDGSGWVGGSSVVHVDRDGNLICKAPVESCTGLAIDDVGDVWAADTSGVLTLVSGTGVSHPGPDGLPRCELGATPPVDLGAAVSGLAMARSGVLWTASSPALRLDTTTLAVERVDHGDAASIAIDVDGNAWFAGRDVHRVRASGPYVDRATYESATGVAADDVAASEDAVWAALGASLTRIEPATLELHETELPGRAGSVAVDAWGRPWALAPTGMVWRFDPATGALDPFDVAPGHVTEVRGDPALGSAWSRSMARTGSHTKIYDAGYLAEWRGLTWYQEPADAEVQVFLRLANTRDGLDTSALVCGPYTSPPADPGCLEEQRTRFVAVTFLLRGEPGAPPPLVGGVRLAWTRP